MLSLYLSSFKGSSINGIGLIWLRYLSDTGQTAQQTQFKFTFAKDQGLRAVFVSAVMCCFSLHATASLWPLEIAHYIVAVAFSRMINICEGWVWVRYALFIEEYDQARFTMLGIQLYYWEKNTALGFWLITENHLFSWIGQKTFRFNLWELVLASRKCTKKSIAAGQPSKVSGGKKSNTSPLTATYHGLFSIKVTEQK